LSTSYQKNTLIRMTNTRVFLALLQSRFEAYSQRLSHIKWSDVQARLLDNPEKLASLGQMEESGGEVCLLAWDEENGRYLFFDCAAESPSGRRSICYDEKARLSRKNNAPATSAESMAMAMGVELLDEEQYRFLQSWGPFDQKSSSWIKTPEHVRSQGGALFGDWRYGRLFIYHNGAQSYYSSRGFRTLLRV
jgi:hypothetical protein